MNIEIEHFIAEVKKTRDFSAFVTANPNKTSKKAEIPKPTTELGQLGKSDKSEGGKTLQKESVVNNLFGEETDVIKDVIKKVSESIPNIEPNTEPNTEGSHKLLKQDKIETIEDKLIKPLHQVKTVKPTQSKYTPFKISQEFINHVQAYQIQESSQRVQSSQVKNIRRVVLGEDLHEQLMHLKHRIKAKSMIALVNVILTDFMNNNKSELEELFSEPANRIGL
jgi:hypothetical protein